jgi:DNA-binding XRE family transcriptional regulator
MGQLETTARPRSRPDQSPEEQARVDAIRERLRGGPAPLEEILGPGRIEDAPTLRTYLDMMKVLDALKASREAAGLTLADVSRKSGMDPAAISRLENGRVANPTITTLQRYAAAIGKRFIWGFADTPQA